MSREELLIPGDPQAIREAGVDKWQESFSCPVSERDFHELSAAVFGAFDKAYVALDRREKDLMLSDTSFLFLLCQHLNVLGMEKCGAKEGYRYVPGEPGSRFDPARPKVAAAFRDSSSPIRRLELKLRGFAKQLKFGAGSAPARLMAGAAGECLDIGTHHRLKREYVARHGLKCSFAYIQGARTGRSGRAGLPNAVGEAAESVVEAADRTLREKYGATLDVKACIASWRERLSDLLGVYEEFSRGKKRVETVLLSEVARPLHKVTCLALRRNGARVVGFHHGNNMGNAMYPYLGYIEHGHCDEYVCPTRRSAANYESIYGISAISKCEPVEFTSVDTGKYAELLERSNMEPPPGMVETVMVVGNPMLPTRYLVSTADYFMLMLDFEIRAMRRLRECGYRVVYKAHPETCEGIESLVGHVCDEINTRPFEEVWREGDAFVFGCIETTIFGVAVCLPRPVAILDIAGRPWNPAMFELIKKRCITVPADFGAENRLAPDWDRLTGGLAAASGRPDYSYVREAMIPENIKDGAFQ